MSNTNYKISFEAFTSFANTIKHNLDSWVLANLYSNMIKSLEAGQSMDKVIETTGTARGIDAQDRKKLLTQIKNLIDNPA